MPRINSFRIQSRNIFLTYPNCPLPKNECLNLLLRLNYPVKPYYIRVCAEHHSNGTPHLHCLLQFTSKFQTTNFNFFDLVSQSRSHHFHPNVQAARNAAAVQSYISKGGDFCEHGTFTESSNPRVSGQGINAIYKAALATKNRDVAFQMMSDADTKYFFGNYDRLCHNWARMFKAPPEEYVSPYAGQFNNVPVDLQEWARDNIRDPAHRTYRPRSIVIEGPTRIGKTLWARSLGPHNHYAGHLDMAKHSNDAYYNIVDDVPPKFLKHWRELFGSQVHWQSNCKYHKPIEITGGIPTIFLCNPGTETSYKYYVDNHPDPGLKAWTLANADFFFVTESFFTTSSSQDQSPPRSGQETPTPSQN